jgi:hypothetical protein
MGFSVSGHFRIRTSNKGNTYPVASGGTTGCIDLIGKFPTALSTYKSGLYDPEGILGKLSFKCGLVCNAGRVHPSSIREPFQAGYECRCAVWDVITGGIGVCRKKHIGGLILVSKNLIRWVFVFWRIHLSNRLSKLLSYSYKVTIPWHGFPTTR